MTNSHQPIAMCNVTWILSKSVRYVPCPQGGTANSMMQSRIKLRLQSGEEEKYYGNRV